MYTIIFPHILQLYSKTVISVVLLLINVLNLEKYYNCLLIHFSTNNKENDII